MEPAGGSEIGAPILAHTGSGRDSGSTYPGEISFSI